MTIANTATVDCADAYTLINAEAKKGALLRARAKVKEEYINLLNQNALELAKTNVIIQLLSDNIDVKKYHLARTVVYTRGWWAKAGTEKSSIITDAIKWFSEGCVRYDSGQRNHYKNLFHHYYGTKSYDRWDGQRSDHEYGFGPRHGSIIFQFGLIDDVRKRKNFIESNSNAADDIQDLITPEEREAVLYYLNNLPKIDAVEQEWMKIYETGYKITNDSKF